MWQAYVSVCYDENRATVTTSAKTASLLQQRLRAAGVTATEVGLHGRFHCECYRDDIESLISFCDTLPNLQFPEASGLVLPTRSNSGGDFITQGRLHHIALRSILVEQSLWHQTFGAVHSSRLIDKGSLLVCFGLERCVPPLLMRGLSSQLVHMANLEEAKSRLSVEALKLGTSLKYRAGYSENDIAVIGLSCKVAGADDLEEFWKLLCEGQSQHIEVPKERVDFETLWRDIDIDPKRKWYGNFVKDHDAFDHKFFKKSPQEVTSQDPQQRLMMQIAYQAVEQSGYLNSPNADKHVGCYIGVAAVDYENNVACYAPNAFSAKGSLKSFVAGNISSYFGWTGPGLTIDTACSASAVAVHQACQAILHGECTAALAGGTSVMTDPLWFQNLAGASFLSPTGACNPFDAKADGYCRGEGIAAVFLKQMSKAIADGDPIIGCIGSTAVYQNPVLVPNSPSLSNMFRNVTQKAGLEPQDISFVEAHGTGSPVGDSVEYESILQVLGGPIRSTPLPIGSLKGHIGHTECASGVIALIKILLMIQEGVIPPQASFQAMSHHIKASPSDMMEIVEHLKDWNSGLRAALINNYGASGSIASMVVTQPLPQEGIGSSLIHSANVMQPFWICGFDERSLREYSARFKKFIRAKKDVSIADLAFNVYRQSNRTLAKGLMFGCSSVSELEHKLTAFIDGDKSVAVTTKKPPRPVVLCFGGLMSTFIGLDQKIYDGVSLLRSHLDQCHTILESIGLSGLYPEIFQITPIEDPVKLQTMLFAIQYSCAKSWIDAGVEIAAVIGHSFGELTALCITDVLSLKDTMKIIAARAKLVRDCWGIDRGSNLIVEADLQDVNRLLIESCYPSKDRRPVTIACFNGPRTFTLAGASKAIDAVAESAASFPTMRVKKTTNTNAFHSSLVEPLMADLKQLGQGVTFNEPSMTWERATKSKMTEKLSSSFFADHMRNAVYFSHALQRLSKKFPSCIWLEAGSDSTVTTMASRALEPFSESHYFQSVNISGDNGLQNLIDTSMSLWIEGLSLTFWAHHPSQTYEYAPLLLPPYQFEKSRHWLKMKKPQMAVADLAPEPQAQQKDLPKGLYTLMGYQDSEQRSARFRINTMIKKYEEFLSGHFIAQTACICPATLQVDLAIEALLSLRPDFAASNLQPQIHRVKHQAPICVDASRAVWLDLEVVDDNFHTWDWRLVSTKDSATTLHVSGTIIFRSVDDPHVQADFARYVRFVGHQRCLDVLNSPYADDIIQGRNIYKTFAEIVDYGEMYRGLQKLVGKGEESAGRVVKQYTGETWLDTHLSECFTQVGSIWANCMTDRAPTDMFIANGFEQWIRSPKLSSQNTRPPVWDVFASHHHESDEAYVTDIFIFDPTSGALMEVIIGINYARVSKLSMGKILSRLTAEGLQSTPPAATPSVPTKMSAPLLAAATVPSLSIKSSEPAEVPKPSKDKKQTSGLDILSLVKAMLADLSGLQAANIMADAQLADLGIDSVMSMELAHELDRRFGCSLPAEQLMDGTTLHTLVQCVQSVLGPVEEDATAGSDKNDDEPSVGSQSVDSLSNSQTSVSSMARMDVAEYLADILGVEEGYVSPDALLRNLGVGSLLSTKFRSDIANKFKINALNDVVIEELTVKELDLKINGQSRGTSETANAITPESIKMETLPVNTTSQAVASHVNGLSASGDLNIPAAMILGAFGEMKLLTDQFIVDYGCADYLGVINPKQTQLCVALALEAFEQLGCALRSAKAGQKLDRIGYLPQHGRLAEYLYTMLEKEARLIDVKGGQITRTAISPPDKSSREILQNLMHNFPDHGYTNKLIYFMGSRLAEVMIGKSDGIKLIFGSEEGRELVSEFYGDSLLNKLAYKQMGDFIKRLVSKLPMDEDPLKILEMGAGTGGVTKYLVPLLANLNVQVEYTFTDVTTSSVAAARTKFKAYPFMKFRTYDIEKAPASDLLGSQHIIIANNAVHATYSLTESAKNIRKALRPDGFLLMLEITEILYWMDMIFGCLESWWLFNNGRQHTISHQSRWERELESAGYGHVEWTDGNCPENSIQRIIIAMASGPKYDRLPISPKPVTSQATDSVARQVVVDEYILKSTHGFTAPIRLDQVTTAPSASDHCVLVTGATGSLGSHLVAHFAGLPNVKTVICLNRRVIGSEPGARQRQSMESRGIKFDTNACSKLRVFETDTAKPMLGLPRDKYEDFQNTVTHVLHNAWPMSGTRPVKGFGLQFQVMRNLIDLVRGISCRRDDRSKVSFQFISSIATVGRYPIWSGNVNVPEERTTIESVLSNGYGDAKFVCERMLDETLHKYPDRFRVMAVRLGQVSGSKTSGYWNPAEHLSFLIKSSKTLKALPDLDGLLSWTPVNDVAATLGDLLLADNTPHPIYHIDNPVRQPWGDMIPVLADALDIPRKNVIPFDEWVKRVRNFPGSVDLDNPAAKLIGFLEGDFIRMACGELLLDTTNSRQHSKTLANVGPVSEDTARKYIQAWKKMGFLYE